MTEKSKKEPIFSSRVERAAGEFIGSAEKIAEITRQNRKRRVVERKPVAALRRRAKKRFAKALPGSTPRLRRNVIQVVGRRLFKSFRKGSGQRKSQDRRKARTVPRGVRRGIM